jgi:O-antigen/teichoic acid export membrane protein
MLSKWIETYRLHISSPKGVAPNGLVGTLIGGVAAGVSGLFLSRALGAVAQALIVRRLGVALYGEYAALLVSLSLLASLLGLGFDTWLLQAGGRDPQKLAQHMRQVLAIKTIAAAVMLGLLAIVWSNRIVQRPAFVVGAFATIFDSFSQTGYSALRARRRNLQVAIFQTITPLLLLLTLFALQRSDLSVLLIVSVQATCSLAIALVVLSRVWHLRALSAPASFDLIGAARQGWLFVAADGLSNIYGRAGLAILGATVGTTAVGLLSPALNLIQFTYMVPNLIFVVGLPLLIAPDTPPREYWRVIRMMLFGSVAYGLAALIALWFFGSILIRIVYGSEFDAALPLVKAMSLMPLLKACSFVWVSIILSYLEQRMRVLLQVPAMIASVAVGLLLIPAAGVQGAAWLYLGIEALLFVLYGFGAWWVTQRGRR